MKKKFFLPLIVAAFVAIGYMGYGVYGPQSEEDALLLENVEALTQTESSISGGYIVSSGKCKSPCEHKSWVSCKSGGSQNCLASDCC